MTILLFDPRLDRLDLFQRALAGLTPSPRWAHARGPTEALALARGEGVRLVLLAGGPGGGTDPLAWLTRLRLSRPNLPVILSPDVGDDEQAVLGMKAGLADYVPLTRLRLLPAAVRDALREPGPAGDVPDRLRSLAAALRDSEARLIGITDAIPGAVYQYRLGPDGTQSIPFMSQGCRDLWGIPPEEIQADINRTWALTVPEDLPGLQAAIAESAESLQPFQSEHRIFGPGGAVRWVRASSVPTRHEDGSVVWNGLVVDVTDRREAERALEVSERRFRALVENAYDAISLYGPDGLGRYHSPPALRLMGRAEGWGVGASLLADVHPGDQALVQSRFAELLRAPGQTVPPMRIRARHASGEWRWIEAAARNLLHDPAIAGVVVNWRDVTEQKQLEARFLRAQRLESVGTLAGGIAHDLNNVLTPVSLAIGLLRTNPGEPRRSRVVDTIDACVTRAAELLRRILDGARGQEPERKPITVPPLLDEVQRILRPGLTPAVQLECCVAPGLAPVLGDGTQLVQVLVNLIVNARDAMPQGGRLLVTATNVHFDERTARAYPEARPGPYVLVGVSDTGTGIAPELLDRLFDPFFTTKEPGKGTGLGLTTVLGIVRRHDGFVDVDSQPGEGTLFRVWLPAQDSAPALPHGDGVVVVVEEEDEVRDRAGATLAGAGYQVLATRSRAETLAQAAPRRGEIVAAVVNIMTGLDGIGAAVALRELSPGVRIVATGPATHGGPPSSEGWHAFLPTPYADDALLRTLAEVLAPKAP